MIPIIFFSLSLDSVFRLTVILVLWLESKHTSHSFTIDGANIADLEVLPHDTPTAQPHRDTAEKKPSRSSCYGSGGVPPLREYKVPALSSGTGSSPTQTLTTQAFVDPAIISLKRPPTKREDGPQAELPEAEPLFIPSPLVEEAGMGSPHLSHSSLSSKPAIPITTKPKVAAASTHIPISRQSSILASATLSEPFSSLTLDNSHDDAGMKSAELAKDTIQGEGSELPEERVERHNSAKRRRRTNTKDVNVLSKSKVPYAQGRGPGYAPAKAQQRTSAIEMNISPLTPSNRGDRVVQIKSNTSSKKQSRREKILADEAQNGWATEDATDIQELGDFDFEANLTKFDKRTIFDQLRRDDTTADEARLVHHNRLPPKPGTSGGKNLHWTENVLEPPTPKLNGYAKWNSEAGESESSLSDDARVSSGRSAKRSVSRSAPRKPPSRKGSGAGTHEAFRTTTTSLSSLRHPSFDNLSGVVPKSHITTTPTRTNPFLRISTSNKLCPCLSPFQILEFEQYGISDLGMTEDMIIENAARGIAETVTRFLRSTSTSTAKPSVTVLAGNHKSGARAVAAARHLRNHGIRVNACILGSEREDTLLDSIKQQSSAYRKAGGKLYTPSVLSDALKGGQVQPTLIVDALLGIHSCFDDLRRDDQATYFDIVLWVNRNKLEVMSIDVPSGVDVLSGEYPRTPCYNHPILTY